MIDLYIREGSPRKLNPIQNLALLFASSECSSPYSQLSLPPFIQLYSLPVRPSLPGGLPSLDQVQQPVNVSKASMKASPIMQSDRGR